jgi:hypothetical protein
MKTLGKKAQTPPPAPASPEGTFEQLDIVLRQLVTEHEKLLGLAAEHRRAIAQADAAALGVCLGHQQAIVQKITGLERQRQTIVHALIRGGNKNVRMSEVTAHAPEPMRSRLAGVAAALREILNKLHQEHLALHRAAETLSMHMEGLLRQVCRGLSHTGTYARGGAIDSSVQVVSSMDVRS